MSIFLLLGDGWMNGWIRRGSGRVRLGITEGCGGELATGNGFHDGFIYPLHCNRLSCFVSFFFPKPLRGMYTAQPLAPQSRRGVRLGRVGVFGCGCLLGGNPLFLSFGWSFSIMYRVFAQSNGLSGPR